MEEDSDDRMNVKVTVIIPTHNCQTYLGEAIESVFRQTLNAWELIIVDDGSTDATPEIVRKYLLDRRVKYVFQEHKGLPAARNRGLFHSKGETIQFLDADDLVHPEKLERQTRLLEAHPEIDGVISGHLFFKGDVSKGWGVRCCAKGKTDIRKELLKGNFIVVNAPLVRKRAIVNVGGFDESLTSTEDWDLWLRISSAGSVLITHEEELAYVRVHGNRMTSDTTNIHLGRYEVIKKHLNCVPVESSYWKEAKDCYVRSKLALARIYVGRGEFGRARVVMGEEPRTFSLRGMILFLMETTSALTSRRNTSSSGQ